MGKEKYSMRFLQVIAGIELLLISTLPVLLFLLDIVPLTRATMFAILALVFGFAVAATLFRVMQGKWKLKEIGFVPIQKDAIRNHAALALFGLLSLFLFQSLFTGEGENIFLPFPRLLMFSIAGSLFQEFLYRSYSVRLFEDIFPKEFLGRNSLIAFLNIAAFVFMHMIFADWQVLIPLTLVGGVIFTFLYMRHRSLLLVSIVHGILNYAALSFGFFAL